MAGSVAVLVLVAAVNEFIEDARLNAAAEAACAACQNDNDSYQDEYDAPVSAPAAAVTA
jgi:hypothetical protein